MIDIIYVFSGVYSRVHGYESQKKWRCGWQVEGWMRRGIKRADVARCGKAGFSSSPYVWDRFMAVTGCHLLFRFDDLDGM